MLHDAEEGDDAGTIASGKSGKSAGAQVNLGTCCCMSMACPQRLGLGDTSLGLQDWPHTCVLPAQGHLFLARNQHCSSTCARLTLLQVGDQGQLPRGASRRAFPDRWGRSPSTCWTQTSPARWGTTFVCLIVSSVAAVTEAWRVPLYFKCVSNLFLPSSMLGAGMAPS